MRYKELFEYDAKKTYNQWGEKLLDRLSQESKRNEFAHEIYNKLQNPKNLPYWFEKFDPTQDNKYTEWLIRTYVKGGIEHLQDIPEKANRALQYHNRLARSNKITGQQKNIDSFKSLGELQDLIDSFYQEKQTTEIDEKGQQLLQSGDAELVYNGPDYRVVIPYTHEASCYFGSGTRWCTTERDKPQYFNEYSKDGKFYYVTDKNRNTKMAINFGASEYRDAKDEYIEPDELMENYPELMKKIITHEGISTILKRNPAFIDYDLFDEKTIHKAIRKLGQKGSIYFAFSDIKSLPENLEVKGDLVLYNTTLEELPENLTVGGILDIGYTKIHYIPKNLNVGTLNMPDIPVENIPEDTVINNSLIAMRSDFKTIEANLDFYKLDLTETPMEEITSNINFNQLEAPRSQLKILPDNLTAEKIILGGTPLKKLPDNLTVKDKLLVNDTGLKEIPKNLKVDYFVIKRTPLAEKYESFVIRNMIVEKGGRVNIIKVD